ncbi:MAG TPA: hypothetical protein VHQ22_19925 [Terriglobales bacterium]|jgi:hypothetical protein|nr:hypothetical protein [Terriglobales bacterium]
MTKERRVEESRTTPFSIAKKFIEIGITLGVFGYFSLRSFCNVAGIPLPGDLGSERYLHEAYTLAVDTVVSVLTPVPFLMLLILIGAVALTLPTASFMRIQPAIKKLFDRKLLHWVFLGFLLASAFFFGQINRYLNELGSGLLIVGKLSMERLSEISSSYYYWVLALVGFVWSCFLVIRKQNQVLGRSSIPLHFLQAAFWSIGVLVTIYVPLVYGTSLKSGDLYVVKVSLNENGAAPICGARLFETSSQLLYWNAENGVGHIDGIPTSKIKTVSYLKLKTSLRLPR